MKKKLSQKELVELRKRERARKELEFDLAYRLESDERAQEKYLSSNRAVNFISGMIVSYLFLAFLNRFVFGSMISQYTAYGEYQILFVILQLLVFLIFGYLNMRTMGKFTKSIKDFILSFFSR